MHCYAGYYNDGNLSAPAPPPCLIDSEYLLHAAKLVAASLEHPSSRQADHTSGSSKAAQELQREKQPRREDRAGGEQDDSQREELVGGKSALPRVGVGHTHRDLELADSGTPKRLKTQ